LSHSVHICAVTLLDVASDDSPLRAIAIAACLLIAALHPSVRAAAAPAICGVAGTISSGGTPLPGVVVSIVDDAGRSNGATTTGLDGSYAIEVSQTGRYTLRTEFVAFAPMTREVTLDSGACRARIDLTLTLASRVPAATSAAASAPAPPVASSPMTSATAARPGRGGGREQSAGQRGGLQSSREFQSLALRAADDAFPSADDNGAPSDAIAAVLPPGFSPEASAEAVTSIGSANASESFFAPNGPGGFADRFGVGSVPGGADGPNVGVVPGQTGAGFGGRGGFAGGGPFGGGLFGRGRANQIRGSLYQSFDSSFLDAPPYPLNGQATTKPDYLQQRFGATLGGPLVIPKLVNSPRTFFFLNYTGNHSTSPYDAYSTVPTAAERSGDFSASGRAVIDPATGLPFPDDQIPAARLDPAAQRLLAMFPLPNQSGDRQNFHTVTTSSAQLDDVNVRAVRTFGAAEPGRGGGRGGFGGGRSGRGGGAGRAAVSNLTVGLHYRHSDTSNTNPFPTLGGSATVSAVDLPVGYSFMKAGMLQSLRFQFNRQDAQTQNLFAFAQNVSGAAGIAGVATDPFDWGAPNISLSSFTGVRDVSPAQRVDRTLAFSDSVVKTHGRQTYRFGGDFRDIHADSRSDANARGTFVFTGLYTGLDFGDYLLGLPQQSTVQFGPGLDQFRSRSWDLFVQDDWRATDKLTLNVGLRYEYYSPVSEVANRLVTLDVAPDFSAATPVPAGGVGPYSGALPDALVRPFHGGFAPRVGMAWRPANGTIVRGGYGINYSTGVYQTIATQLAAQPPFAVTNTVLATPAQPIPLETALLYAAPGVRSNNFAVDPDYVPGHVQIWNADLQRDLSRTVSVGIDYTGTRGTNLDILRAPDRLPGGGLSIAGVQPFLFESSEGDSILHALTLRIRKRLTAGVAASASYTLSRSIDDASTIGGGAAVVAQNDRDLAAERGLSSFDQRHRFAGDFTYELPFGATKRWLQSGAPAALFGNWQVNGSWQLASGTPFTARILGDIRDVGSGVNGTLRANYNGAAIAIADPTVAQFFDTGAFSIPLPGTYGNAGRNTIIGPGTSVMNLGLTRNVSLGQTRGLSIQLLANNVFNTVQFAAIDTVVNSPTFGQVTAVRPMRRIQVLTRLRF
jgi:hypothetical protein